MYQILLLQNKSFFRAIRIFTVGRHQVISAEATIVDRKGKKTSLCFFQKNGASVEIFISGAKQKNGLLWIL
jgi:hypothetical protein